MKSNAKARRKVVGKKPVPAPKSRMGKTGVSPSLLLKPSDSTLTPPLKAYFRVHPPATVKRLAEMRALILALVPGALEKISYGIPTVFIKKNLVHYGAYEHHIGFYPGAATMAAFQSRLAPFTTGKGSVQFPLDRPLPKGLIQAMVRYRLKLEPDPKPR